MRMRGLFCVVAVFALSSPAFCREEQFTVNGKIVPRHEYDAARTYNEFVVMMRDNLTERAFGKLKRALLLNPEMSQANASMGIMLARQGKDAEAKSYLLKATSSPDAMPESFLALATLYQCKGDLDRAIQTYELYLKKARGGDEEAAKSAIDLLQQERERRKKTGGTLESKNYLDSGTPRGFMRWADSRMPLKVYIAPAVGVDGYRESYGNLLKKSFYDWGDATKKKVRFKFVDKPGDADIKCLWTNSAEALGNGAEDGEARTKVVGQAIIDCEIVLRAKEQEGAFPFTENHVQGICLHEIGHSLGVNGHSPAPADVMFFSTSLTDDPRRLTPRDCSTMCSIYERDMDPKSKIIDFFLNPAMVALSFAGFLALGLVFGPLLYVAKTSKKKKNKRKKV